MKSTLESVRLIVGSPTHYAARLARDAEEVRAAQALRFEVFNLELNEGLAQSYTSGFDADPFDAVCDHLVVEHLPSQRIVGTYLTLGAKICGSPALDRQFSAVESQFYDYGSLCNTQQLTQPPLSLAVPLSRFTSRVDGGPVFLLGGITRNFIVSSLFDMGT